jgi:hypothetical protein
MSRPPILEIISPQQDEDNLNYHHTYEGLDEFGTYYKAITFLECEESAERG